MKIYIEWNWNTDNDYESHIIKIHKLKPNGNIIKCDGNLLTTYNGYKCKPDKN
jgi:hypothetical protein